MLSQAFGLQVSCPPFKRKFSEYQLKKNNFKKCNFKRKASVDALTMILYIFVCFGRISYVTLPQQADSRIILKSLTP